MISSIIKSFTIYGIMSAADPMMIQLIPTESFDITATGLEFNSICIYSAENVPCKMLVHNAEEYCIYMLQFQSTPPEFSELPYDKIYQQFNSLNGVLERDYFYGLLDYNKNFHLSHMDTASHRFEFHSNFYRAKRFLLKDNETGHISPFIREQIPTKVWNNAKYSILARPEIWAGFVPK